MVTEGVFPRARPHGVLGSGVCLATVRAHFSFILNHNIDFFVMTSACWSFVGAQWTNLEAERSGDVCVWLKLLTPYRLLGHRRPMTSSGCEKNSGNGWCWLHNIVNELTATEMYT